MGRLKKEPTTVIRIPTDKISIVEKMLGRELAKDQTPHVMIRVPIKMIGKVRKAIK